MLDDLRNELDQCDENLHKLFQKRMEVIARVAQTKKEQGLPIFVPQREAEILARYSGLEKHFFQEILRLSRLQQSLVLYPFNFVLIGFMGAGKTSTGEALAKMLGRDFIDLDDLLEQELQMPISRFFARKGEGAFRKAEHEVIQVVAKKTGVVIATGGGAVIDPRNAALLQEAGKLIHLTAKPETIAERLKEDHSRPLLGGDASIAKITALGEKRKAAYEKAATLTIATDLLNPTEVAEEILVRFQLNN